MLSRRKCLAAVSAAIATPAKYWRKVWEAKKEAAGDAPLSPDLGLSPIQVEVRDALRSRILDTIENLTSEPGHGVLVDLWLLSESLIDYTSGGHCGQFAGLFNAIEERLGRDRRFVAVPEGMHEDVQAFIETLKTDHAARTEHSGPNQSTHPENVIAFPQDNEKARAIDEFAEIRKIFDEHGRRLIEGA